MWTEKWVSFHSLKLTRWTHSALARTQLRYSSASLWNRQISNCCRHRILDIQHRQNRSHSHTHAHVLYLSLLPPAYLSIPALLGCFCIVFLLKLICRPDVFSISVWASSLSLSHLLLLLAPTAWEWKEQTHSHILGSNAHTRTPHAKAAGDPEALHSAFGHTNLISWHMELSWCKLVCFLCFSRLYLLWERSCSLGQQVVDKLGVKGGAGACFPVYQILSFRLYREIDVTVGCDQDIFLWEFVP